MGWWTFGGVSEQLFYFAFLFDVLSVIHQVSLSSGHMFDRDVELLLYYQDAHKPTAIVEAGQDSAEPGNGFFT